MSSEAMNMTAAIHSAGGMHCKSVRPPAKRVSGVLAICVPLSLAGCRTDSYPVAEVQGRVMLDGKPLSEVQVTFVPEAADVALPSSFGTTAEDGQYGLTLYDGRSGAVVGWHRVVVEDLAAINQAAVAGREAQDEQAPATIPLRSRSRVPERYTTTAQSPLRREVRPDGGRVDVDLTTASP